MADDKSDHSKDKAPKKDSRNAREKAKDLRVKDFIHEQRQQIKCGARRAPRSYRP
jgi:hypothetical protein